MILVVGAVRSCALAKSCRSRAHSHRLASLLIVSRDLPGALLHRLGQARLHEADEGDGGVGGDAASDGEGVER